MKLGLYVWTPYTPDGLYVAWYYSWEDIAWFLYQWADLTYVFTVIDEGE